MEEWMLQVYVRTFDLNGKLLNTAISGGGSSSRPELERHLDKLIEGSKPNAGYDPEQGYWWIRGDHTLDRYTIE
jgi:hypothetical protein